MKAKKVLMICTSCLNTKQVKRISKEPKQLRVIAQDSCPECLTDPLIGVKYFDADMNEILIKP